MNSFCISQKEERHNYVKITAKAIKIGYGFLPNL